MLFNLLFYLIKMESKLMESKNEIMLKEVLYGLSQLPKTLPFKYLYDKKGSELFEQICGLEEYYLTRTELEIMEKDAPEMASVIGENCIIIELGCGNSEKTKLLLNNLKSIAAYIPVDISKNTLKNFVDTLKTDYQDLKIIPICADFIRRLDIPELNITHARKIVYFPGSTLCNISHNERYEFFKRIQDMCGHNGRLLISIDLIKDKSILENAYNDKKGITAAFNLNILSHINSALNANFNIDDFSHKAIFNEKDKQIEMYLISKSEQEVKIGNETILFNKDESILTEISSKYTIIEFEELISNFFKLEEVWTDKNDNFGVLLLKTV